MTVGDTARASAKPFLRWAGGKRWLAGTLQELTVDLSICTYYEPFLGGGAAFFSLPGLKRARLSDTNGELIDTWNAVKEMPDRVFASLTRYKNTATDYYRARDARPRSDANRAARFIFLNHTSFNGIYRVNLKGVYNVPYGSRKSISLPTEDDLHAVSSALEVATIEVLDFEDSVDRSRPGDLCFLDPPYTVAHNNNGFIKYNQKLFSLDDQQRLASALRDLRRKEVSFIMTNAAHTTLHEMFSPVADSRIVNRKNAVGGKLAARGVAAERLYTSLTGPTENDDNDA